MDSNFRTLLVIGGNPDVIAAKYSMDTKVNPYIKYRLDDKDKLYEARKQFLIECCREAEKERHYSSTYEDRSAKNRCLSRWNNILKKHMDMDSFQYYQFITEGCWYDDNGDAWTDENPNAHYKYQKCYDYRIKADQTDEAPFSNPFILKDGTKAYTARVDEIDWDRVHMANTELYYSAWKVCVEGKEPETDEERMIQNSFSNRKEYFSNFKDADQYVAHSCAFWTYGVATADEYISGDREDSIKWTTGFYDRFIKQLDGETVLSIYEIKLL